MMCDSCNSNRAMYEINGVADKHSFLCFDCFVGIELHKLKNDHFVIRKLKMDHSVFNINVRE